MRSILRDPGAPVIVGLLSFSASFVGMGLAITALTPDKSLTLPSIVAFVLAGLLFIFAIGAIVYLLRHFSKTKWYIRQIGIYLRQGRKLRGELLSVRDIWAWTDEMKEKVPQWKAMVQHWLGSNLPDHALEFDVEGFLSDLDTGEGVNGEASRAAQHLEGRMGNLREILRDIRR